MKKQKVLSMILTIAMVMGVFASVALADVEDIPIIQPGDGGFITVVGKIIGFIQYAAWAIAIGMIIYIGIKYTMSAANEKADLKKGLINFVIGAVIIAGAATICGWLASFGSELGN